jgi:anaerobic selenocysteine-containing dehydrogenase
VESYKSLQIDSLSSRGHIRNPISTSSYVFSPIEFTQRDEVLVNDQYPMVLAPGRVLFDAARDASIVVENDLNTITRREIIEINEGDAKKAGISEGDVIKILGEEFELTGNAHLNGLHSGMVATTTLFGALIESLNSSSEPDPMAKIEGLRLCKVRIEKV